MHSTLDMHSPHRTPSPHPIPAVEACAPLPSPASHSHDNSSILLLEQGVEHPSGVLVPLWLQQKRPARGAKDSYSQETQYKPELIFLGGLGEHPEPWTPLGSVRILGSIRRCSSCLSPQLPAQIVPSSPLVPSPVRGTAAVPRPGL